MVERVSSTNSDTMGVPRLTFSVCVCPAEDDHRHDTAEILKIIQK